MSQYIKATAEVKPGEVRAMSNEFIGKLKLKNIGFKFTPEELWKQMSEEYKIDYDEKLSWFYISLTRRCEAEIYDMDCIDANMPPFYHRYRDKTFL